MATLYDHLPEVGIKGTEDWFFGNISRERSNEILLKESIGVYLIRTRLTHHQYALSVRDKTKTSHYKIEAVPCTSHEGFKFKIGAVEFAKIEDIISHYEKNKLAESVLTRPATRPMYKSLYKYEPRLDEEDEVALNRYECVTFYGNYVQEEKEEPEWWRVQRRSGEVGFVPAAYLRPCSQVDTDDSKFAPLRSLDFPFEAEALRQRNPNILDQTQLKLEIGDIVDVTQCTELPEIWLGANKRTGQTGAFPFNYVRPRSLTDYRPLSVASNRVSQASGSTIEESERL